MFTIQAVENPQWANENKTCFTCLVQYAEFNEAHPTGVDPKDGYAHIQELWAKGNAGEYGAIADYVKQPDEYPQEISTGGETPSQPTVTGTQTL